MSWKWTVVGIVVAIGAVTTAPAKWLSSRDEAADLTTLTVGRATLVETAVALATIELQVGAEVRVGSQVSGIVDRLEVEVGDPVRAGDLLVTLRDAEQRAAVAALAAERAAAEAELDLAETQLTRARRLRETQVVPQSALDEAERALRVRRANVDSLSARLSEARITLGYTTIRAPISGTVASVSTQVGETVAASFAAPTFVTIVDLHRLEVRASVDETDIGRVRIGQEVTLRVDAFPGQRLPGRVRTVYPKAELVNNVVNYVVIVDVVDAHDLQLRPEMTVHVDLPLARRDDVVALPRGALFDEGGRQWVVAREGDGWSEREVVTGMATSQQVEIVSGLTVGDVVVADREAWRSRQEEDR